MFKKVLILTVVCILILGGVFYYGRWTGKKSLNNDMPTISSQIILDKIQDQNFLVTKTLFLDNTVDIELEDSLGFKGFFVGDSLQGRGVVRVDIGIDINSMTPDDVIIDTKNKTIIAYIPEASILDSSLFGDVEIQTKKGIWTSVKDLFNDNESEDYNRIVRELINISEKSALEKTDILRETRRDSGKNLELIIKSLSPDYKLDLKEK